MKVLLKTTKVFFALLCLANVSQACGAEHMRDVELSDSMNRLAEAFITADSEYNWAYMTRIQRVTENLLKSPQSTIEEALDILGSERLSHEEKLDTLVAIYNETKARANPRATHTSSSSSDSSATWLENLRKLANEGQNESLHLAEALLNSLPESSMRDILEDIRHSEVTAANVTEIIAELHARIESIPETAPEGLEMFKNLLLPRGSRAEAQFTDRLLKKVDQTTKRLLNQVRMDFQSMNLPGEIIQELLQVKTLNSAKWSELISNQTISFDESKEEGINMFMELVGPEFLEVEPENFLAMTGWL